MMTVESIEKAPEIDLKIMSGAWTPAIINDTKIETNKTATRMAQRWSVPRERSSIKSIV
jgi:hypothetical protein